MMHWKGTLNFVLNPRCKRKFYTVLQHRRVNSSIATNITYGYMDKKIDEGLKCTICREIFVDPASTPCRYSFCPR